MTGETKMTIVAISGFGAMVAAIALMADCSRDVARTNAEGALCIKNGGKWVPASAPANSGFCVGER